MNKHTIEKIISGGQTGVDRAALDVAISLGIPHGGWCPKGRLAEDGIIPLSYQLEETPSSFYEERTEWNVRDSDGTLVITTIEPSGGTLYTIEMARKYEKPLIVFNAERDSVENILGWLSKYRIQVLNVAGPRESEIAGVYKVAHEVVSNLICLSKEMRRNKV